MPSSLNTKHYHVFKQFKDAFIIEDDILITPDFPFEQIQSEAILQGLDLVFFGGVSPEVEARWGVPASVSPEMLRDGKLVYFDYSYKTRCTHGYWISHVAAKRIIDAGEIHDKPIDHALNHYIETLGLVVGWTEPFLLQQSTEELKGGKTIEHFYHLTEGQDWFTFPALYRQMVRIAPAKAHFVEVGVWKGRSAAFMAVEIINSGKTILLDLVDTWEGSPEHQDQEELATLYDTFLRNISPVRSYVNVVRMDSIEAAKRYEDNSLDFVFIDAAHEYDAVKADIQAWLPKVKPGGFLAGHDYYPDEHWSGVKMAVDEIFGVENIQTAEFCWLVRK